MTPSIVIDDAQTHNLTYAELLAAPWVVDDSVTRNLSCKFGEQNE